MLTTKVHGPPCTKPGGASSRDAFRYYATLGIDGDLVGIRRRGEPDGLKISNRLVPPTRRARWPQDQLPSGPTD
jgi:hypothetical protein